MSSRRTPANEAISTIREFAQASHTHSEHKQQNTLAAVRKHARKLFRYIVGRKPTLQELEAITG